VKNILFIIKKKVTDLFEWKYKRLYTFKYGELLNKNTLVCSYKKEFIYGLYACMF
jgi:hypothetical protein